MTIVNAVEVASTSSKPTNGETLINIVLDETGSMGSCWDPTISSFNEFIGGQKTADGVARVTLSTFSTNGYRGGFGDLSEKPSVRKVFESKLVDTVPALSRENYRPNGGTNLYDAIGHSIRNIESQLDPMTAIPNVLMVIITDGEENSSTEYKLNDIKGMIQEKEKEGWTFIYLGANQDAWNVGASFGLAKGQTMSYSTADMKGTMGTLNAATTAYRGMRSAAYASGDTNTEVVRSFFDDKTK